MTYAAVASGLLFPSFNNELYGSSNPSVGATETLDATAEKLALIGRVYIDGRPAAAKTISPAGGGSIGVRCGAVTFANAGTTLDVGIQDVATGSGPLAQPDGTFDVKATLTGGGGGLTGSAWNTVAMTGGTGTKDITHGDLIAVVFDMTARAGADSVIVNSSTANLNPNPPLTNIYLAAAWRTSGGNMPNVVITFDDATIATLDGVIPMTSSPGETWADATNPDERGLIFRVPWACKIDALCIAGASGAADADFTLCLYSDPLGTPSALETFTVLGEQMATSSTKWTRFPLTAERELTVNTDYMVAMRATGAGSIDLWTVVLNDENYRKFLTNGTTLKKATRDGGSGAFSAESPAVTLPLMAVRISSFYNPSVTDTELAAIRAKTDSLTFSVAGHVDSNIQRVNDVALQGDGSAGNPWGP